MSLAVSGEKFPALTEPPMEKKMMGAVGPSIPSGLGRKDIEEDDGRRFRFVTWAGRGTGRVWPLERSDGDVTDGELGSQDKSGGPSLEYALSSRILLPKRKMYSGRSPRRETLQVRREFEARKPSKSGQGRIMISLPVLSKYAWIAA